MEGAHGGARFVASLVILAVSVFMVYTPSYLVRLTASVAVLALSTIVFFPLLLPLLAPKPRLPLPSEKTYLTTTPNEKEIRIQQCDLPCWFDAWLEDDDRVESQQFHVGEFYVPEEEPLEPAQVAMSVVIPAFNEAKRIVPTLEEAVSYLDDVYGRAPSTSSSTALPMEDPISPQGDSLRGYEILIVDDGSTDDTVSTVLSFCHEHALHDIIRVVRLERNRGKGGAVIHGFRHVRGHYALFADADGATRFQDLQYLVQALETVMDGLKRGVAIGSRARMVRDDETLQRSRLRNFLMHAFHFVLTILTPAATSRIKDTQCGFKLLSRAALPHIVPYMRSEGWIFDIEMLMLAESSPPAPLLSFRHPWRSPHARRKQPQPQLQHKRLDSVASVESVTPCRRVIGATLGIRVAEVPVTWHEVPGSKMNLFKDSIKMAWGLAILRFLWMMGVYSRRELFT